MMDTQQKSAIDGLQQAVLQAALDGAEGAQGEAEKNSQKTPPAIGKGAAGPGRPKGVRNKLVNLRDAVLEAFEMAGGPQYLYQLSQGTQSDRAAFVGLMSKVLPTQINANVEGGIQVQLSWLGQRNIGTTVAQNVEEVVQVVDLERDSAGKYRIIDQKHVPAGGGQAPGGTAPEAVGGDGKA
jgi:hypothetical protein